MKTLLKDTIREVKNSFGRFISILLIIALGVGFFAGIKATAPDMKHTGDVHFDKYNLMDFWVLSSMGFDDNDVEAFKGLDGIEKVTAGYSKDGLIQVDEKDTVAKLMSLPKGYKNSLNKPILVEGRLAENKGECVLEATDGYMKRFKIGSRIKVKSGTENPLKDDLENDEFTVVGFANSPLHITFERGTSSIGNGKVNTFMIVNEDDFKSEYYTDMYLGIGKDLDSFSDQYKDRLEEVKKDIEILGEARRKARLDDIKEELDDKLVEGREKLEEERVKGQKDLDDARSKISKAKEDIKKGESALSSGKSQLVTAIKNGEASLNTEEKKLNQGIKEYEQAIAKFNRERPGIEKSLEEGQSKVAEGEKGLLELEKNIGLLKEQLETLEEEQEIEGINAQIAELEGQHKAIKTEVEKGKKEVEKGRQALIQTENQLKESKTKLDSGRVALASGREKLKKEKQSGESKLNSEKSKLESAKNEIADAEIDYQKGLDEFDSEIAKAERDLKKLEKEIKKLEKPDWYIVKRSDTRDYIEFEMGADRIDSVAQVFPLFFLLIALLVCLTTMTRMVDEQRGYIGTLKALGYSNNAIMSKYLLYGLIASLLGSILGLLVGFKVFPTVIFNAYRLMFIMPPVITGFNIAFATISTIAAVFTTFLAVFLAVRNELRETPALLMRPKAPKVGKRIFLERITPLWNRLKFSQKVTARNIFRYKRRLFMTIIGIAGCTALLVAGFGLKDSIMDITVNQFDVISDYQMSIDINDGVIDKKNDPVIRFLDKDERVESFMLGYEKPIEIKSNGESKDLDMIVVEDDANLDDYIKLRNRLSGDKLTMDNDSILLTEKMAEMLDVKKGDKVSLLIDDLEYEFTVKDLTENYAFHYVYMTESLYEDTVGKKVEYNKILAKNIDTDKDFEDSLSEDLLEVDDVSSVLFITGLSKSLNDTMDSLNSVVIVIIVAAGALAFIVLYNLTNINVSERMREIATIKVLGFYDNEVSRYVYRENNILTIFGTILGLFMGLLLHQFIILTVEIEMIMFGRRVRPISLLYAAILTILFSLLVNFVMHFRLKKIDMVESMKSVD